MDPLKQHMTFSETKRRSTLIIEGLHLTCAGNRQLRQRNSVREAAAERYISNGYNFRSRGTLSVSVGEIHTEVATADSK